MYLLSAKQKQKQNNNNNKNTNKNKSKQNKTNKQMNKPKIPPTNQPSNQKCTLYLVFLVPVIKAKAMCQERNVTSYEQGKG